MRQLPQPFGRYQLLQPLGHGGMAEVWRARELSPDGFRRTLTIKRILPPHARDPMFVHLFEKEARLIARLRHPNIVEVLEFGEVDGEPYLALEFVRGHDLVSLLRAHSEAKTVPPPGLGAYVVRELCRALAHVHALADESGRPLLVVHRDVTPSNVMLTSEGRVKLLDFGIAKPLGAAEETVTQAGGLKGKLSYMSPEQIEGGTLDLRTDIYSAGVVLYELLTARRLFRGKSELETIRLIRTLDPPPPSSVEPQVPQSLDAICLKAIARRREDRYTSCAEMAAELDAVVASFAWGPEQAAAICSQYLSLPPPDDELDLTIPMDTAPAGDGGDWIDDIVRAPLPSPPEQSVISPQQQLEMSPDELLMRSGDPPTTAPSLPPLMTPVMEAGSLLAEQTATVESPPPRSRRWRVVLIGGLAGALLGAIVLMLGGRDAEPKRQPVDATAQAPRSSPVPRLHRVTKPTRH